MAFDDDERRFFESVEGPLSALLSAAVHAVATQRAADPKAFLLQFFRKGARATTTGTLPMSKDDERFFETVRSQVEALIGEAVHEIVTKRVTNFEAHLCEFFRKAVEGPTTPAPKQEGFQPHERARRRSRQAGGPNDGDDGVGRRSGRRRNRAGAGAGGRRAAPPGMAPPQHQMTAEQEAEEFGC